MRPVKQIQYNKSPRNGTPIQYIVIHDTGNTRKGANAEAHYNYFNGGNRSSSADFFVDDKQILCINDYTKYYTWQCGDGKGKYGVTNSNSIGIEICINSDSDRSKAVANAIALTKELMAELNIPIERVVRHYDASRKMCPGTMAKNDWAEWKEFKQALNKKEEPAMYNSIDEIPSWAKPTIQKLINSGCLNGTETGLNLSMDMIRMFVILDRAGVFK